MGWLQQNSPFLIARRRRRRRHLLLLGASTASDHVAPRSSSAWACVIFIHELGHFLAAKWCDVHVQTFSLGFGPALPGCSFKCGETTYKIGILPLGGYVQMVGEGTDADEDENYPRSFKNKTVLQRMLIISAGVVMNVLLGCVCFVIVYQFHGVRDAAGRRRGEWTPVRPPGKAGIPSGAVFTEIGSTTKPTFEDLQESVALDLVGPAPSIWSTRRATARRSRWIIRPRLDANDSQPVIGVSPPVEAPAVARRESSTTTSGPACRQLRGRRRLASWTCGPATWWWRRPTRPRKATRSRTCRTTSRRARSTRPSCADRMRGLGDRDMVLYVVRRPRRGHDAPPEDKVVVPCQGVRAGRPGRRARPTPTTPTTVPRSRRCGHKPGGEAGRDYDLFDYQERMKRLAGKPAMVQVLRVSQGAERRDHLRDGRRARRRRRST